MKLKRTVLQQPSLPQCIQLENTLVEDFYLSDAVATAGFTK
jgi:hypothetical protein